MQKAKAQGCKEERHNKHCTLLVKASPATVPPLMDLATLDANVEGFDFMISAASAHMNPIANNRKLETVESATLNSRIRSLSRRSTSALCA